MFTAQVSYASWPAGIAITITDYEITDRGGPKSANLEISGQDNALWGVLALIGKQLVITNDNGVIVWHGIISKLSGNIAGNQIAVDLGLCYNAVAVEYTAPDAYGASQSYRTDWATDANSISAYGRRELIFSIGEASTTEANYRRGLLLAQHALPALTGKGFSAGISKLTVACVGTAYTLDDRSVSLTGGRVENIGGSTQTLTIGWQLYDTTIGFSASAIHDINARLGAFNNGDIVAVSGSVKNNGLKQVSARNNDPQVVVTSTQIEFDAPDDCYDWNGGFGNITAPSWVVIGGDTSNAGIYYVESAESTSKFRISPGGGSSFTSESSNGNNRTVTMGHKVTLATHSNLERPGPGVLLNLYGSSVAQRFYVPSAMDTGAFSLQVRKVGDPIDGVRVTFYADSGGNIGSSLFSVTLAAADMPITTGPQEIWIDLPRVSLNAGYYWFIVDRSGAISTTAYFQIGITDIEYYSTLAWTGLTWTPLNYRDPPNYTQYSVPFRLYDTEDTATSIERIIVNYPSPVATTVFIEDTGVLVGQYRDNKRTAYAEITALVDSGNSAGERLVWMCSEDGRSFIYPSDGPDADTIASLHQDGRLYSKQGAAIERGVFPVGRYMNLPAIPESVNAQWNLSPVYVASVRYDLRSGQFDFKTAADDTNSIMFVTR